MANGPVVNDPINLDDFLLIKSTMAKINQEFGCNLNFYLVSYYKNGEVSASPHCDDKEELGQNQHIVVVSLDSGSS
jgi:hypothetical protein